MADSGTDQRLTIGEAAARLGTSRLRVREALAAGLLTGYRNNQGQWLVDLETLPVTLGATGSEALAPERLIELLFDEVEELQNTLEERDRTIAQMTALLERQGAALDRAMAIADRQDGGGDNAQIRALSETSERAMALLESALDRLGDNDAAVRKLTELVERGLITSEEFDRQLREQQDATAEKQAVIERQGRMIDRLFSLTEKVLGLTGVSVQRNGGLLRRLFNRSRERG